MNQNLSPAYKSIFNSNIHLSLRAAASIFIKYPSSAIALTRVIKGLKRSEKLRVQNAANGVEVPPIIIVSTTETCNLNCAGCYACAQHRHAAPELSAHSIQKLLHEASGLGVSIVMLAGGEPLLNQIWLDALGEHDEFLGIVFTNGTLMDNGAIKWFDEHRHVIPALSIEGSPEQTDARRGKGVYEKVIRAMQLLNEAKIPFGISVTLTSSNIDTVLHDDYLKEYMQKGCHLFMFVEYVPVEPGSEPLTLSIRHKHALNAFCAGSMNKYPVLCIPFPGDESEYGGCLAAGRGFIHISANGNIEPCPFAPFSDQNIAQVSLKEALCSKLLSAVRDNHHLLKEGEGGCALWHNRQWLESLINP